MSTYLPTVRQLFDSARSRRRRHAAMRELAALPPGEAEQILRDIDLSMSDMWALTRANCGPGVLLPSRLTSVGLNPASLERLHPQTFHDLQISCVRCASWRRCARDLAAGAPQTSTPAYCLNKQLIDNLTGKPFLKAPA